MLILKKTSQTVPAETAGAEKSQNVAGILSFGRLRSVGACRFKEGLRL